MKSIFIKNSRVLIAGLIILLISLILGSFNLIIISISIMLCYKLFSKRISNDIFDSKLFKYITVFLIYILFLQCGVLIGWLINHNFSLNLVPTLVAGMLIIIWLYEYIFLNRKKIFDKDIKIKSFCFNDIISILLGLFIVGIVIIPPVIQTDSYRLETFAVSMVNGNSDDSAHISMINDCLHFDKGVIFGSDSSKVTRNNGSYPASWHAISAIIIKTLKPTIKTGGESIFAYAIIKSFWLLILIYLISKVTLFLHKFINDKKNNFSSYFWIISCISILSVIQILPSMMNGFYSILPQYIYSLLLVPFLMQISLDKDKKDKFRILPLLIIVGVVGCLSWLLPLPVYALTILSIFLIITISKSFKNTYKNFLLAFTECLPIILISIISTLVQIFIILNNKTSGSLSFIKSLLIDGGIITQGILFYIFIAIGFVISMLLIKNEKKQKIEMFLVLVAYSLLYCSIIYLIQIRYIERNAYYYYKLLDILTITIIPFAIAGVGVLIDRYNKYSKVLSISIIIIILTSVFQMINVNRSTLGYAIGNRFFYGALDKKLINELDNHLSQKEYFSKHHSFVYASSGDYYFQNEVGTMILKSNEMETKCFNDVRHTIWKSPSIEDILDVIEKSCDDYKINIITNQISEESFKQAVATKNLNNSVSIITY